MTQAHMSERRLTRIYLIRGLDRLLYCTQPLWPEGTFDQAKVEEGRLILHAEGIQSPTELADATTLLDLAAERFRLAISMRTGCPLTLRVEASTQPTFDPPGVASVTDSVNAHDDANGSAQPRIPPVEIEQIHVGATGWILTLTEARNFGDYPDEILKRLYLLIEELIEGYAHHLTQAERDAVQELKWIRHFVSHSECDNPALCRYIAASLPSAVIAMSPTKVRFDRTNIDHRNFVGRQEPIARGIASKLLDAAIADLS
jgi:hypothetical protein